MDNGDVVDNVPTYPNEGGGRSMISGVTNQAMRIDDDQSVAQRGRHLLPLVCWDT